MNIRNSYDSNADKGANPYVSSPNFRGSAMSSLDARDS